jgi:hypothetical protein
VPHHPASPAPLREFLRNQMMPAITASLEKQGLATFYYGNFDRHHTRWSTFGDSPRFGTEYVGVRGRMTILSEAYAYISYEARIVASREFLGQCLDYVAAQREPITRLLKDVRRESSRPTSGEVALRTTVTPLPDKVVVRGYKPAAPPRASHPAPTEPHDYTVDFYTRYEPTLTAARPQAYLVPAAQTGITDRLKWHGIRFDVLRQDETRDVEAYQIISLSRSEQAYQNRHLLQVEVAARRQRRRIPAGTLRVPTAQPLGNLVMLLLEPVASDSLATWNVIQPELQPDEEYPVWRISER